MGGREGALLFEVINRGVSAHFVGGIPIGDSSDSGAVDPFLRVFGRVDPVMPRHPAVPAGAPGELRLDATKSDFIPEFPY